MNIALGKSFLRRLLGMILQVDAELICVLATSVSSPCIRWRLAKYFLVFFFPFQGNATDGAVDVSGIDLVT